MRFFLEFVSCCGSPRFQEEEEEEEAPLPAPAGNRWTTTHARSNNNNNNNVRRKKKRRGQVGNGSDEWKPSLGPISEHYTVAVAAEEEAITTGRRVAKRRGESVGHKKSSRDMANIAALYEESRDSSFGGALMPTFSGYSFLM